MHLDIPNAGNEFPLPPTEPAPVSGWVMIFKPGRPTTWHWFEILSEVSICGRAALPSGARYVQGGDESPANCHACLQHRRTATAAKPQQQQELL